uniref:Protein krueppel n=1 Tax=Cuerna arida TaxID=1464854 RepID=A0A1B6GVN6_9HEMI
MTEIQQGIFDSVCRLCSTVIISGVHTILDNPEGSDLKVADQIWECLQIKVSKDDNLPQSVCTPCYNTTQQLFAFRLACHKVQTKLKQCKEQKDISNKIENEDESCKTREEPSDGTVDEAEDPSEVISTDNEDSECQENGNENLPELGEPSPEDYVLMKEETFSIDANKVNSAGSVRGKSGVLADHLVEFNNNSDLRDRDVVEIQRVRQELLPPMWDVYEKSSPNETGELQVTHRRYIVSKGAFPCSLCGACFRFDQGCERGEVPDSGPYDCVVCHKVFPKRSAWKKHQATHEDVKPFLCRECGKGFNRQEHLSRHLLSHTATRPFMCEGCGKSYARKEHLNRHQFSSPSCADPNVDPVRPFTCPTCNHGFVRKEHLVRHCKRAHDVELNDNEPKPFTCQICSKTFTRREHLRRHKIVHAKDDKSSTVKTEPEDEISPPPSPDDKKPLEPVKCEICFKTFSRRSHVLRHMKRIHNTTISGEIHRCNVCNKQFGRKYHLERHQLCHAKPEYECVTCGEKFDQSDLLDKHMTTVHGNAAVDSYLWM